MKRIVIVGAGGFAREVAWLIEECNEIRPTWHLLGFVEADASLIGQQRGKYPVIGDDSYLLSTTQETYAVIGIGNPGVIRRVRKKLESNSHLRFPNLIHPTVRWDIERVAIGEGNIICASNILTTDVSIGSFNILNLASTFGHDTVIGDCNVVNIGVHLSGGVTVGTGCLIGTGAVILENRSIGDGAIIGAGAVVTKDVPPGLVAVGVPARPLVKSKGGQHE